MKRGNKIKSTVNDLDNHVMWLYDNVTMTAS